MKKKITTNKHERHDYRPHLREAAEHLKTLGAKIYPVSEKDIQLQPDFYTTGIAIRAGINGYRCLDIDNTSNQDLANHLLENLGLPSNYHWLVGSGSGWGYHIWFRCEEEPKRLEILPRRAVSGVYMGIVKKAEFEFERIELRWENSYIVAPPSQLFVPYKKLDEEYIAPKKWPSEHPLRGYYFWLNSKPTKPPAKIGIDKLETAFLSLIDSVEYHLPEDYYPLDIADW